MCIKVIKKDWVVSSPSKTIINEQAYNRGVKYVKSRITL